ncbi:MAG: hypothetical protein LBV51_05275 [Acholeplasmatales bacterium]|jgi:magnesium-transporting ATPase (P-type)|nr:hypothetical protein [Acholeplasmatales bacterium]
MKIRKIIFIVASIFILFIISYLVYNFTRINSNKSYTIDDLNNKKYENTTKVSFILFDYYNNKLLFTIEDKHYNFTTYIINDIIITLSNDDESFVFFIIDSDTLYLYTYNMYFYNKAVTI